MNERKIPLQLKKYMARELVDHKIDLNDIPNDSFIQTNGLKGSKFTQQSKYLHRFSNYKFEPTGNEFKSKVGSFVFKKN